MIIPTCDDMLAAHERIERVPGHCDPTANIHDGCVGVYDGKVELLWPVSARGEAY